MLRTRGAASGRRPDFWGNNYFDDTYFHNGAPVSHEGYCTDVWFEEAMKFIDTCGEQPFFAYVATNAPHAPFFVAERYRALYQDDEDIPEPGFYGMITNIDENFGRLRAYLEEKGIADNTILIFMTDNGSAGGCLLDEHEFLSAGYNAGMRGRKASYYDGGHRVPFFMRWPGGALEGPRDIEEMALHIDLLPTLIDLCQLTPPENATFDGTSLAPLLRGACDSLPGDRIQFLQYRQHTDPPEKWFNAVMTRRWRLVKGSELYDIKDDPAQRNDVADEHPDVVARLRAAHEGWWADVESGLREYCPIALGNDAENPTRLNAMDVMGDVAWHQSHIARAQESTGCWTVDVEQPGRYRFTLRRWPEELGLPIDANITDDEARQLTFAREDASGNTIHPVSARIGLFDWEQTQSIEPGDTTVVFECDVAQTGVTRLDAWFVDEDGDERGAYYVYVERLADE